MNDVGEIAERVLAVPLVNGRRIIAIAGPPASGKTTLAAQLAARIGRACVVAMDGFHRDNEDLERHGLLARKGAPETFDAASFVALVKACRAGGAIAVPTFDRDLDRVVPGGASVAATDETILVEGNYLLLEAAPWSDLAPLWDFTLQIRVPVAILRRRLIDRWLEQGLDEPRAIARAEGNDLVNVQLVQAASLEADLTVDFEMSQLGHVVK